MPRPHFLFQCVNDLFQRFDVDRLPHVIVAEAIHRKFHDFMDGLPEHCHFLHGLSGEMKFFISHFLGRHQNINGMIGNPLKITNVFQQRGRFLAIFLIQRF